MRPTPDNDERVRLLAKLGAGGMADVFLGLQVGEQDFSRFVVVKKIHARHIEDDQALGMFFDEARTIAQLNHPHVVKIFDLQRLDKEVCLTMEYIDGEALSYVMTRLRSGGRAFPPSIVCKLILDALDALQYAHEATHNDGTPLQLVHRDISPQNLMVDLNGYVKVIDFGIAKTTMQTELTSPGGIKGKVTYLAPESFTKRNVDRRVDVYALGIVLWECLTLRKALAIRDAPMQEVMDAVCNLRLDPASDHNEKLTPEFDAVINRSIAIDRNERYATCEEFASALREVATATVGIASASEVAAWFKTTFSARLTKRKKFEQDALARMIDDDAEQSDAQREDSLPTAAALAGDAVPAAKTEERLAEVVGPEDTASKQAVIPADPTPATFNAGAGTQTLTSQVAAPRNPYVFLGFLFFLFLIGAVVVRFLFFGGNDSEPNVVVKSTPPGATVFVDAVDKGVTTSSGLALLLRTDESMKLTLKREGFETFDQTVEPKDGTVINVVAQLVPLRADKPVAVAAEPENAVDGLPDGDDAGVLIATAESASGRSSGAESASGRSSGAESASARNQDRRSKRRGRRRGRVKPEPDPTPKAAEPAPSPSPEAASPPVAVAPNPPPSPEAAASPEPTRATPVAPTPEAPTPEATPAAAPPAPKKRWYSRTGKWSGPTVLQRGCGRCHNAKTAPRLALKRKTKRQWDRFFSRDQHRRHGDLDLHFSDGEQKRVLGTIQKRIADDSTFGLAGDR